MRTYGRANLILAAQRRYDHIVLVNGEDVTDMFQKFSMKEDVDAGTASGTLVMRREATGKPSLSPLMGNLTFNPFSPIEVKSALSLPGTTPNPEHYITVFSGLIDDPEFGGIASKLEVNCRDLGARLADTLIIEERKYGSLLGIPIEDVLSEMAVDNGFDDLEIRIIGDTQGWSLQPFTQKAGVSLWEAMRALVIQMGWDFRYWWHEDGFFPTLRKPIRTVTTPDRVIGQSYFDLSSVRLNGTDVRNWGKLPYKDRASGQIRYVTAQDNGSIAAFQKRAFGLPLQLNVDTQAEAQQMIDAAVADMATPYVEQNARLPYMPDLQLGDALEFTGDGKAYADDMTFGVGAFGHEISFDSNKAYTVPELRGRPVGAYMRWLSLTRAAADATVADLGPAPTIGPLLGEAFCEEGETKDGGCWLPVRLDKGTMTLRVFSNTGKTTPLEQPEIDNIRANYTIQRQEGDIWSADVVDTILFFATTPQFYRRTYSQATGMDTRVGLPVTHEARAFDGFEATMGKVTTFAVSRSGSKNTLTWVAEPCTSPYDVELIIWRNGLPLARIPWAASGAFEDPGLPADRDYTYQIQSFTTDNIQSARSGPRASVSRGSPGTGGPSAPPPAGTLAPPEVTADVLAGDRVRVTMIPTDGRTTEIELWRKVGSAPFFSHGTFPVIANAGPILEDVDTFLGLTVLYKAIAKAEGFTDSAFGPIASVTPTAPAPPPVTTATPGVDAGSPYIDVEGTAGNPAATIRIYKAPPNGSFSLLAIVDSGEVYRDSAVMSTRTYTYYTTAQLTGQPESAPSASVNATAPSV